MTDALVAPLYTVAEAARLVRLPPVRVRRWLYGYEYALPGKIRPRRVTQAPVVRRVTARYASFLDLIELLFIRCFVEHGLSLPKVRRASVEASAILQSHHPFALRRCFTDGREIYIELEKSSDQTKAENLFQLLSEGQWVIAPVILQIARQITFDERTGFSTQWWPLGPDEPVVLDPQVCFGAPTVAHRGIKTSNIYDIFLAERKNLKSVGFWFDLHVSEIRAAIRFEEERLAA